MVRETSIIQCLMRRTRVRMVISWEEGYLGNLKLNIEAVTILKGYLWTVKRPVMELWNILTLNISEMMGYKWELSKENTRECGSEIWDKGKESWHGLTGVSLKANGNVIKGKLVRWGWMMDLYMKAHSIKIGITEKEKLWWNFSELSSKENNSRYLKVYSIMEKLLSKERLQKQMQKTCTMEKYQNLKRMATVTCSMRTVQNLKENSKMIREMGLA